MYSLDADTQRQRLVNALRREQVRLSEETFRRVCAKEYYGS